MKLLAVDSSSSVASAALIENRRVVAEFFINAGLTHSQTLAPMIDGIIKNLNFNLQDLDFFAVTNGPGSFTGLRISMATVKGMALVLNKPCMGISSLLASAYGCRDFSGIIAACMDARRGEVYNAVFKSDGTEISIIKDDRAIPIETLAKELKNYDCEIKLVGDGAEMCYNTFVQDFKLDNIKSVLEEQRYIKASRVGFAALDNYGNENLVTAVDLKPKYLKVSQAERLLFEKNKCLGENL